MTLLNIQNLSKTFFEHRSKKKIKAVDDISFTLERGELVGLLGPNGAGKTTIIKSICGLLFPDEGQIFVNDIDVLKHRNRALKYISALFEGNRNIYWKLNPKENIEYFARIKGLTYKEFYKQREFLINYLGLKDKENQLVENLSRGMQQKVALAVTFISNTDLVLLDEPTLGIDVMTTIEIRELLKRYTKEFHKTMFITSHDLDFIEKTCERVIIINNGIILADESISKLKEYTESNTLRIHIKKSLTDEQKEKLHLWNAIIIPKQDSTELDISLKSYTDIYSIMQILQSTQNPILSMEYKQMDLESVFMYLLENSEEVEKNL